MTKTKSQKADEAETETRRRDRKMESSLRADVLLQLQEAVRGAGVAQEGARRILIDFG